MIHRLPGLGGYDNLPLHLDHDRDGIVNSEDQDWYEFQQRTGITQEELLDRIRDWWSRNYQTEYGDYDIFWNGVPDHLFFEEDIWDWYEILWEEFWDDFEDQQIGILPYYEPDPDDWPNCDEVLRAFKGGLEDRSNIQCNWYFVLDCGSGSGSSSGEHWWDIFEEIVDCPSCPGYQDYQDQFRDRLHDYWQNRALRIGFSDLMNLVGGQCDAFAPDFESCVQAKYDERRLELISGFINDFRLDIFIQSLSEASSDCNLSNSFSNCLSRSLVENIVLRTYSGLTLNADEKDWLINNPPVKFKNTLITSMQIQTMKPSFPMPSNWRVIMTP